MKNKTFLRALTLIVVSAFLVVATPYVQYEYAGEDNQRDLVDCSVGVAIGIVVLAVGTVVVIGLFQFCKKHLPPPEPPKPPPPPNCTNCNPYHPTWPCTNCAPVTRASLLSLTKSYAGFPLMTLSSQGAVDYVDISTNGWTDPYSNTFCIYFYTTMQSSTNLVNWQTKYLIDGYISFGDPYLRWPSNTVTIIHAPDGTGIVTNWTYAGEQQLPIEDNQSSREFFRLVH